MVTVTAQFVPGDRVALLKVTVAPALAVPEQVLFKFDGDATAKPLGKVSVKPTPVNERLVLVLETVIVIVVVPLTGMVVGENALTSVGGLLTVKVAEGVLPFPATLVESMVVLSV